MKNIRFNFKTITEDGIYVISRRNKSYSYFNTEYRDLINDSEGNIIFPSFNQKTKERIIPRIIRKIMSNSDSISIEKTSPAYNYFNTEYKNNITRDNNNNIIVPLVSYQKVKK